MSSEKKPERRFEGKQRLLHWLIAWSFLFILLTVALRSGWMNKDFMASILQARLLEAGVTVDHDQAIAAAKAIRKPMWNYHIWAGYGLIGLYAVRMLFNLRFGLNYAWPWKAGLRWDEKLKAWSYLGFYFLMGVTLATGFLVVNGPKAWEDFLEEIHVLSLYYVIPFIILHLAGVWRANATTEKGIIGRIVSGD